MYDFVINKLKRIQIEILDEIDKLCKKNNISYQLMAGTLLGAIRHKGYIPWDDDIDICMPRGDYEKFIKIAQNELNEQMFLEHPENNNTLFPFTKVRKNNTEMIEKTIKEKNIHHGIFVDIFPLDNIYPGTIKGWIHRFKINQLFYIIASKTHTKHTNVFKKAIKWLIGKIYKKEISYYNKKINSVAKKFCKRNTKTVASLTGGVRNKIYNGFLYNIEDFNDPITVTFVNKKYPAPRRFHELLTLQYGDYMKLPPIEFQKSNHSVVKVSFDNRSFEINSDENGRIVATEIKNNTLYT